MKKALVLGLVVLLVIGSAVAISGPVQSEEPGRPHDPGPPHDREPPHHYLPMDEGSGSTIYDQSGNGNNGTIYGASWATGVSGTALEFDGVDDYAEVHENTNLDGFDDFSVSIWIKPATDLNSSTGRQDVYYKGPPIPWVISYALNYDDVDGRLQFNLHSQSDWFSYASVRYETEFNAGQWYHIAVTYDGSSEVIMYVNGTPQGVDVGGDHGTISGLVVDNPYNLRLGARTDDQYYFNGTIDELRIYSTKLSDNEILALYEEFVPSGNQPPTASFTYSPEKPVVSEEITIVSPLSILKKYAPVLYFHPGEPGEPTE